MTAVEKHFQERPKRRMYPKPTILVVYGLPGSGKTKLAADLALLLNGMHVNADAVRSSLNKDLGFTPEDRVTNAFRLGATSGLVAAYSPLNVVVVDFVNPTCETQQAFIDGLRSVDEAFSDPDCVRLKFVWLDTIRRDQSRFADTATLFDSSRVAYPNKSQYAASLVITGGSSEERLSKVMAKFFS